ncbi:MAG: NUDIX domain-containing protein, partial [Clostridiales bacterium]|nr:NUDIX domain-containing protein [Clostridiales bacterium]
LLNYIPVDRAGSFNQALIEIGALICIPNGMPKCESCPINSFCRALAEDVVMELPIKAAKKPRRIEDKTILLIKSGDKIGIRKRSEKGLLAGMYELPNLEGHLSEKDIVLQMEEWGFEILTLKQLKRSVHIFSHVEWNMKSYQIECQLKEEQSPFLFVEKNKLLEEYPIPTAFESYINGAKAHGTKAPERR